MEEGEGEGQRGNVRNRKGDRRREGCQEDTGREECGRPDSRGGVVPKIPAPVHLLRVTLSP